VLRISTGEIPLELKQIVYIIGVRMEVFFAKIIKPDTNCKPKN
jgi:hypothetical protein